MWQDFISFSLEPSLLPQGLAAASCPREGDGDLGRGLRPDRMGSSPGSPGAFVLWTSGLCFREMTFYGDCGAWHLLCFPCPYFV